MWSLIIHVMQSTVSFNYKDQKDEVCADKWNKEMCSVKKYTKHRNTLCIQKFIDKLGDK